MTQRENIFYKMGIMSGSILYITYKFDDFEKMVQKAIEISDKYHDMQYCSFVFQAFNDNSYDFEKSCFFQTEIRVYDIATKTDILAKSILESYEKKKGGE